MTFTGAVALGTVWRMVFRQRDVADTPSVSHLDWQLSLRSGVMTSLFEQRQRAAEGLYAYSEERRFLARRRAVEALAGWAGESMGLDAAGRAAYAQTLVDRFVAGTPEDALAVTVQTDLERAGKPSLSGQVGTIQAQATAEAFAASTARPNEAAAADPHEAFARRHPKSHPSWSL